ncbi:hypothetical protein BS47DRAFT_1356380 [Hydnum rufescens UP504]|uniref:Uncharacterized protein n=1 Tax=Hydnum rufescens UP504 TaxID=1448309 RepID=A0A9P6DLN0_9AGAM|nr:hypothetical protein BS47DRAFT_1356380 [Hydnum rufescens UP504]
MLHAPWGKSEDEFTYLMPGRPERSVQGEDTPDRKTNKPHPGIARRKTTMNPILGEQDKLCFVSDIVSPCP